MSIWQQAPEKNALERGDLHVWRVDMGAAIAQSAVLLSTLSADERERAARFSVEKYRDHFVAARGTLRRVLARYLDVQAEELTFSYGEHGKPALASQWAAADLHFNMSHSRDVALCAVARGQQVGVDVEYPRPQVNYERIAERFFSLEEFEALMELPESARRRAFYNIWTRKEAYVKARGDGIAAGLGTFSVSLAGPAELLRSDEGREEVARWRLLALDLDGDYVAALCAAGQDWTPHTYQWADCSP